MKSVRRGKVIEENPRVFCREKNVEVLAHFTDTKQPAVAVKKQANGPTVIFSGMPIHNADLWAAIFKRAGIHQYVKDRNTVVHGNDRYLLVHVSYAGACEVKLPRRAKRITELFSGKVLAENCSKFIVREKHPVTYFMEIEY